MTKSKTNTPAKSAHASSASQQKSNATPHKQNGAASTSAKKPAQPQQKQQAATPAKKQQVEMKQQEESEDEVDDIELNDEAEIDAEDEEEQGNGNAEEDEEMADAQDEEDDEEEEPAPVPAKQQKQTSNSAKKSPALTPAAAPASAAKSSTSSSSPSTSATTTAASSKASKKRKANDSDDEEDSDLPADSASHIVKRQAASSVSTPAAAASSSSSSAATEDHPISVPHYTPTATFAFTPESVAFTSLPLSEATQKAIRDMGFSTMTPVQQKCIPIALKGEDILGAAKTGSGKTLAFLIPAVELLVRSGFKPRNGTGVLIISPTRELALQIYGVTREVCKYHIFTHTIVMGGANMKPEQDKLGKGVNLLVGTPGRILDHLDHCVAWNYKNLVSLIIDEADRILEMGFEEQLRAIIKRLPTTPRQTLLFSATQTKNVKDIAILSMSGTPIQIGVDDESTTSTAEGVEQGYVVCPSENRFLLLFTFLKRNLKKKVIVFFSTCAATQFYTELLNYIDIPVVELHGKQKQNKRTTTFFEFCNAEKGIMLCTDVAARGLDIPSVDWIIQFDPPEEPKEYIHRVGRTARGSGKRGRALLFLLPQELGFLKYLKQARIPLNEYEFPSNKISRVQNQLEKVVAENYYLHKSAREAYRSYMQGYAQHTLKSCFNVAALDVLGVSKSFGFNAPPKVHLKISLKQQKNTDKRVEEGKSKHGFSEDNPYGKKEKRSSSLSASKGDAEDDANDEIARKAQAEVTKKPQQTRQWSRGQCCSTAPGDEGGAPLTPKTLAAMRAEGGKKNSKSSTNKRKTAAVDEGTEATEQDAEALSHQMKTGTSSANKSGRKSLSTGTNDGQRSSDASPDQKAVKSTITVVDANGVSQPLNPAASVNVKRPQENTNAAGDLTAPRMHRTRSELEDEEDERTARSLRNLEAESVVGQQETFITCHIHQSSNGGAPIDGQSPSHTPNAASGNIDHSRSNTQGVFFYPSPSPLSHHVSGSQSGSATPTPKAHSQQLSMFAPPVLGTHQSNLSQTVPIGHGTLSPVPIGAHLSVGTGAFANSDFFTHPTEAAIHTPGGARTAFALLLGTNVHSTNNSPRPMTRGMPSGRHGLSSRTVPSSPAHSRSPSPTRGQAQGETGSGGGPNQLRVGTATVTGVTIDHVVSPQSNNTGADLIHHAHSHSKPSSRTNTLPRHHVYSSSVKSSPRHSRDASEAAQQLTQQLKEENEEDLENSVDTSPFNSPPPPPPSSLPPPSPTPVLAHTSSTANSTLSLSESSNPPSTTSSTNSTNPRFFQSNLKQSSSANELQTTKRTQA